MKDKFDPKLPFILKWKVKRYLARYREALYNEVTALRLELSHSEDIVKHDVFSEIKSDPHRPLVINERLNMLGKTYAENIKYISNPPLNHCSVSLKSTHKKLTACNYKLNKFVDFIERHPFYTLSKGKVIAECTQSNGLTKALRDLTNEYAKLIKERDELLKTIGKTDTIEGYKLKVEELILSMTENKTTPVL